METNQPKPEGVKEPAHTSTFLFRAASTLLETNPEMSPEDRAKHFREMAEMVAKKLEKNEFY